MADFCRFIAISGGVPSIAPSDLDHAMMRQPMPHPFGGDGGRPGGSVRGDPDGGRGQRRLDPAHDVPLCVPASACPLATGRSGRCPVSARTAGRVSPRPPAAARRKLGNVWRVGARLLRGEPRYAGRLSPPAPPGERGGRPQRRYRARPDQDSQPDLGLPKVFGDIRVLASRLARTTHCCAAASLLNSKVVWQMPSSPEIATLKHF